MKSSITGMRKAAKIVLLILGIGVFGLARAQDFGPGNLLLVTVDASANNTTATIVEINTTSAGQSAIQTIAIPATGTDAYRISGSATSTGYAALSNDRTLFTFTGANNTTTSANVNTLNPRAVYTLNAQGILVKQTTYTGTSGNQTRCATSLDNTTWHIGDQGGLYTNGTTTSSPAGNFRSVKSFGGTVYGLTASGTTTTIAVGVFSASSGGTYTGLPGLTNSSSAQDFCLIQSGTNGLTYDVLYLNEATSNTAGTIRKFSLVSGTWTANGSYTTSFGGFGLTAAQSGTGADLLISTGQGALTGNSVLKLKDAAGYNSNIDITTANNVSLYTTGAGTIIKGLAFTPVAANGTSTVNLSVSANSGTEAGVTAITVMATASAPVTGAQTVSLGVSGSGVTVGDFSLSDAVITIANGATTGSVTFTVVNDTLLEGTETASLTISNPSSGIVLGATVSQNVVITDNETDIDLSKYVRVGRHNLPFSASAPLLCSECSAVTYNWDTDSLFVVGDEGTCIVQVTKTGVLIDTMTLSGFEDTESLTYIGGGQFVMAEERLRQANLITYAANTTLQASTVQKVKLGTTVGNIGLEGLSFDPLTNGYLFVKEKDPQSIFQTGIDFGAGTATNGSPTSTGSTDLFTPALANISDFSDVFALSNLSALSGTPTNNHLLIISQESGQVIHLDRAGVFASKLTIVADPDSGLTVQDLTNEGVTMDRDGFLYIVNENGGGDSTKPQLWVYAPSSAANQAPTAVALTSQVPSIPENTSTASAIKVADIVVTDDGLGANDLTISGTDASFFEIAGTAVFLKAGTTLNATAQPQYNITINVDDTTVGTTPDVSTNYALTVTSAPVGTATLVISETAPWSSGNSSLGADWFEVTNIGAVAADITGWKVDDSSASFASALALNGVTTIAPGESVIFVDTANLATTSAAFKTLWFGANPPPGLQIGNYTGSGIGLSTDGDAVNLFDSSGTLQTNLVFGVASGGPTFFTFDNSDRVNNGTNNTLSILGVNGAFAAAGNANEVGSPGAIGTPSTPIITITVQDGSVHEEGTNPGTFRVTRTGSTIAPLNFNFLIATGAGQAINGTDYTPTLSGVSTVPAGQAFVDIVVTPVDDSDIEGNETITLTLGDTGSIDVGVPGSATITITDNETNLPPTAVVLSNTLAILIESANTSAAIKVADIAVTDDGFGTNSLSLSGADAANFQITGSALFLKAGTALNFSTKSSYAVTVDADDAAVGANPDASVNYTLTITQAVPAGAIVVTEVAPWSSGNSGILGVDWIEVTNVGTTPLSTSGWRMDDSSAAIGTAVPMSALTIAPGEAVIFLETNDLPGKSAAFRTLWFGANPPARLQIGSYSGGGVGLSNSNDGVCLFDSGGNVITVISFGASPSAAPFASFDNTAGAGSTTPPGPAVATLSAIGVNGARAAVSDSAQIGSPGTTATRIHTVQGSGSSSPLTAQTVTVEAIVVGDFQNGDGDTQRNLGGFYLQEESEDVDSNALTSEGIFVFEGSGSFKADVSVGDRVSVTGIVQENFGLTQISATTVRRVQAGAISDVHSLRVDVELPTAGTTLNQNNAFQPDLEAFESMLVHFPDTLTISEQFNLDRFNEIKLSAGGRPENFTNANAPSVAGYAAFLQDVGSRKITYDDGLNIQNASIENLAGFAPYNTATAPRMGDTISGLNGVLDYQWAGNSTSGSTWRVRAITTNGNTFVNSNPRPASHDPVGGRLKVGSLNVLNYFKTLATSSSVRTAINLEPRGANSAAEFDRQTAKLVKMLLAISPDVIGLTELENDFDAASNGNALKYLVEQLNLQAGAGTYAAINPGSQFLGGDAIAVGFIYKPASVQIAANTTIESLNDTDVDPALLAQSTIARIFDGVNTSRNALAVTFSEIGTGEKFTAIANHFKSKSGTGTGADADQLDGQGNWQKQRELAAQALTAWSATDPTGSNDRDYLLLGDFNAYVKEDALGVIKSAGFHNLSEERLSSVYSYVFDAQFGALDHAFASASLNGQVTGVTEWHVNADEADALDYNLDFGRNAAIFDANSVVRESDHDPLILGLALNTVVPTVTPNTNKLLQTASTLLINGTGFALQPANNTVVFNSGVGTVTSASATQLTITFTTQPARGSLTAVVTSHGVSSGAPVQVAKVVTEVTVTANNQTRAYGAANPVLSFTSNGLLNGDTLAGTLTTTAAPSSSVGTYAITQGTLDSPDYLVTFTPGTLSVTAVTVTVAADNKSKPFGSANPLLTFTYGGFVNGETSAVVSGSPILSTLATTGSAVGDYPITVSLTGVSATNYTFSAQNGTLSVTALTATITAVTPAFGPTSGGTIITIEGTNLLAGSTVTVGGVAATNVTFNNGKLTAVTSAHTAGKVDVQVSNANATTDTLVNAFEYNDVPTLGSGITLTPTVATVGQPISVSVGAVDPEGGALTITYSWGDGASGTASSHTYLTPGQFNLTVTVSDGLSTVSGSTTVTVIAAALPGGETDSDGDGVSDAEELAANTNPNSATSTPATNGSNPFEIPQIKMAIALNFNARKTSSDSITLTGTLNIPSNFQPSGQTFIVNVGGIVKSFTLDNKGSRKSGGDSLSVKAPKNQVSKFSAKFTKGNFKASLADEGLTDSTTSRQGTPTTVKVNFIYGGLMYQEMKTLTYKATKGKTGKTK